MSAEPTIWNEVNNQSTSWYQEAPEFAYYDSDRLYDADVPYDLAVSVSATKWSEE